jgi:hypothetical protein
MSKQKSNSLETKFNSRASTLCLPAKGVGIEDIVKVDDEGE